MRYTILDELDRTVQRFPSRTAVRCETEECNYLQLQRKAKVIGTALCSWIGSREGVGVFMDKTPAAVYAFLGAVYAGGFYSVLNPELPETRLQQVVSVLKPAVIVTDQELFVKAKAFFPERQILLVDDILEKDYIDEAGLLQTRRRLIDTDPLYVNFTSGSTGVPKGIAVCHRSVLDFIRCFTEIFSFSSEEIIANQAPFDFDVSVKDIYSAILTGSELLIIPRRYFSEPVKLADYLCENHATVMTWAVSALCLLTAFHVLESKAPERVRKIIFSGEVMPLRALRYIRKYMPDTMLVNVYGPTEITCNCTYHVLEQERDYADGIPIGIPFPNEDVFLLDDQDQIVSAEGLTGEICVRGTALALGYYGNQEQNAARFVLDPRNCHYPETIYRTGDLGKYDSDGELMFCGRKDFQIKYMGHRIELEEIEKHIGRVSGVERCCCLFDEKRGKLHGFYLGSAQQEEILNELQKNVPVYMIPGRLHKVDTWPLTKNGKTDRVSLAEWMGGRKI